MTVTYCTGAPVDITLEDDGTVSVVVFLGEVTQDDDIDEDVTDDNLSAIVAAIDAGRVTITHSKGA